MPLQIVRGDITSMQVDAVVKERDSRLPQGDRMGGAVITDAHGLPARHVIHAAAPVWRGGTHNEADLLAACYTSSLNLALEHGFNSVAFPLLSSGRFGYPQDKAMRVALTAIGSFLLRNEMMVYIVLLDTVGYALADRLAKSLVAYIDDHYVERRPPLSRTGENAPVQQIYEARSTDKEVYLAQLQVAPTAVPRSLRDVVNRRSEGFTATLLRLIDASGKTDPEVYKRANIDRKLFSKIRSNLQYRPSKNTALALAVALELNIDQTADLLLRAGYALSPGSRFDLIVKYFICAGNFNIFEINEALFAFDESTLGA